jgi:hypothetical protein
VGFLGCLDRAPLCRIWETHNYKRLSQYLTSPPARSGCRARARAHARDSTPSEGIDSRYAGQASAVASASPAFQAYQKRALRLARRLGEARLDARQERIHLGQMRIALLRVDVPQVRLSRPLPAHERVLAANDIQVARPQPAVEAVLVDERHDGEREAAAHERRASMRHASAREAIEVRLRDTLRHDDGDRLVAFGPAFEKRAQCRIRVAEERDGQPFARGNDPQRFPHAQCVRAASTQNASRPRAGPLRAARRRSWA